MEIIISDMTKNKTDYSHHIGSQKFGFREIWFFPVSKYRLSWKLNYYELNLAYYDELKFNQKNKNANATRSVEAEK